MGPSQPQPLDSAEQQLSLSVPVSVGCWLHLHRLLGKATQGRGNARKGQRKERAMQEPSRPEPAHTEQRSAQIFLPSISATFWHPMSQLDKGSWSRGRKDADALLPGLTEVPRSSATSCLKLAEGNHHRAISMSVGSPNGQPRVPVAHRATTLLSLYFLSQCNFCCTLPVGKTANVAPSP